MSVLGTRAIPARNPGSNIWGTGSKKPIGFSIRDKSSLRKHGNACIVACHRQKWWLDVQQCMCVGAVMSAVWKCRCCTLHGRKKKAKLRSAICVRLVTIFLKSENSNSCKDEDVFGLVFFLSLVNYYLSVFLHCRLMCTFWLEEADLCKSNCGCGFLPVTWWHGFCLSNMTVILQHTQTR